MIKTSIRKKITIFSLLFSPTIVTRLSENGRLQKKSGLLISVTKGSKMPMLNSSSNKPTSINKNNGITHINNNIKSTWTMPTRTR